MLDLFDGVGDMERGVIRCVGDATQRFGEDALRIMRAIRFSAQLGYTIEENTRKAITLLAPTLDRISAERIQVELTKLLCSPHPDYLRNAYEMGVTKVFLPEFDACMETPQNHPHHMYSVGEHILHCLMFVEADKILRLSMLFHDIGKPRTFTEDEKGIHHFHGHPEVGEQMTREILRRLRYDNDTIHKVCTLVRYHDYGTGVTPNIRIVRRAVNKIGEDVFPMLFPISYADIMSQSLYKREEKLASYEQWKVLYREICEGRQCVSLKGLAITGKDLIDQGMKPGKELGEILNALLEQVLDDPALNTREYLLWEVAKRLKK